MVVQLSKESRSGAIRAPGYPNSMRCHQRRGAGAPTRTASPVPRVEPGLIRGDLHGWIEELHQGGSKSENVESTLWYSPFSRICGRAT